MPKLTPEIKRADKEKTRAILLFIEEMFTTRVLDAISPWRSVLNAQLAGTHGTKVKKPNAQNPRS